MQTELLCCKEILTFCCNTVLMMFQTGCGTRPFRHDRKPLTTLLDVSDDSLVLGQVAALISRAQVPPEIMDALGAGRLRALQKPDGGVRGIVVGEIFQCSLKTKSGSTSHFAQTLVANAQGEVRTVQCLAFSLCIPVSRAVVRKGWTAMDVPSGWVQVLRGPRPPSQRWPPAKRNVVTESRGQRQAAPRFQQVGRRASSWM